MINRGYNPVLEIFYEDLKSSLIPTIKTMLNFIQFPYFGDDVEQSLHEGVTKYYRNHTDSFEHFTSEQKNFVNGIILQTMKELQHHNNFATASKLQTYL